MQFQVPQFIEVEDKIFGPLTGTQFIYVAGGIGFLVVAWLMFPLWAAILLGAPVAGLGLALAFLKINNRPFIETLQAAFEYTVKAKLYVWQKKKLPTTPEEVITRTGKKDSDPLKYVPATSGTKIKDLAWSLDVHDSIYSEVSKKKE